MALLERLGGGRRLSQPESQKKDGERRAGLTESEKNGRPFTRGESAKAVENQASEGGGRVGETDAI